MPDVVHEAVGFRRTAAVCLVLGAALSTVWVALQPPFPAGYDARLAAIDLAGGSAAASAFLFAASQLPMLVALLGIAVLAARGARVLAGIGAALGMTGAVGHAVYGGAMLVTVLMARDAGHRAVHAGLLETMEHSPLLLPFAAAGLLGTVLGVALLGGALWRSRVVPRWVPALLWVFLVVEFVGSNLSEYAGYASGTCLLVAFCILARRLWVGDLTPEAPSPAAPRAAAPSGSGRTGPAAPARR